MPHIYKHAYSDKNVFTFQTRKTAKRKTSEETHIYTITASRQNIQKHVHMCFILKI